MHAPRNALILSGGGARGAYQVGVLKALAELAPRGSYPFDIVTGVSVGALNASVLGSFPDSIQDGAARLEAIWRSLHCNNVYRTDRAAMVANVLRWSRAALFGWAGAVAPESLLDNSPLRDLLETHVDFEALNDFGGLRALAITASSYRSGRAVTYFATSRKIPEWGRARGIGVARTIKAEHVLASAALPLVFPPVSVGGVFFGDGALRENAPLSTAIRLGADRILSIAARDGRPDAQAIPADGRDDHDAVPPTIGDISGHMLDILFNDNAASDVENLERINGLLRRLPEKDRIKSGLRIVDHAVVEPTADIRTIAGTHKDELPASVQFVINLLGGMKAPWVLPSYLMFEPEYVGALIDLGYQDGKAKADELRAFID